MKSLFVGLLWLLLASSVRAEFLVPTFGYGASGGASGYQGLTILPGGTVDVNVNAGGTRTNANQDQTLTGYVYLATTPTDHGSSAMPLGSVDAILPGNSTSGPVTSKTLPIATTFNGAAFQAGTYYIVFYASGTQGSKTASTSVSLVIPDVEVQQPPGTDLSDNVSTVAYPTLGVGTSTTLQFAVNATGTANLTNVSANITSSGTSRFNITIAPGTTVPSRGATYFSVSYSPVAAGTDTAVLHVYSSVMGSKNPFDINLSGRAVILPTVSTLAVVNVTSTSATIQGSVNANGATDVVNVIYNNIAGSMTTAATPASVTGNATTAVSAALTGLNPGSRYSGRIAAINGGVITDGQSLVFFTLSTAEDWRRRYFGSTANLGDAADDADPDGDGITNLMERALGLNPTVASLTGKQTIVPDQNGRLVLTANRGADSAGMVFTAEVTSDLQTWTTDGVTVLPTASNVFQARDDGPVGSSRFMRLRVSQL